MSARLGEILTRLGAVTQDCLQAALEEQKSRGGRLGSVLVELGHIDDEVVATALAHQHGVPCVDPAALAPVDVEVIRLVPLETAFRHQILPLQKVGSTLTVAITDPTNVLALDEVKFMTGLRVEPVVATEHSLKQAIEQHYGTRDTLLLQKVYDELITQREYQVDLSEEEEDVDLKKLEKSSAEAPVIRFVNVILAEAIRRGASDIHLEPYEKDFRVRYRVDGVLYEVMRPPLRLKNALISRVKIMANLDISQRRLPQDGRIKLRINEEGERRKIDFRASVLPTLFGEKIVLRILDRSKLPLHLDGLGLAALSLERLRRAIALPYGIVLVTGPTGSGKTSTLYSCINQLNTPEVNIMTAEDPVEFNFPGINQVQTNEALGLTFAAALRSFLRQDPNIVLVGEIRDLETAEVAVKAALTGHLVLSTLHTNDAPSTLDRLVNMGVESFLVASSTNLICAQRLVRKICRDCKEKVDTDRKSLVEMGFSPAEVADMVVFRGAGCPKCNQTGYQGRTGLFEILQVSGVIRELILGKVDSEQLREAARREGMSTLRESGLEKIRTGVTTPQEVLRETSMGRFAAGGRS